MRLTASMLDDIAAADCFAAARHCLNDVAQQWQTDFPTTTRFTTAAATTHRWLDMLASDTGDCFATPDDETRELKARGRAFKAAGVLKARVAAESPTGRRAVACLLHVLWFCRKTTEQGVACQDQVAKALNRAADCTHMNPVVYAAAVFGLDGGDVRIGSLASSYLDNETCGTVREALTYATETIADLDALAELAAS